MKRYLEKVVYCTVRKQTGVEIQSDAVENCREIKYGAEGILYIADDENCLRTLKSHGLPAAAWLHEGNLDQNLSAAFYALESPKELDLDFFEKIYRREKGIPWDILETKRCLVREMVPEDAKAFADIYREPAVSRYMKDFHTDEQGEAEYIREYQQQYRFFEYGVWSIVLKETGEVIGRAGFSQAPEVCEGDTQGEAFCEVRKEVCCDVQNEACCDMREEAYCDIQSEIQSAPNFDFSMKDIPQFGYLIGVPWQGQGLAYEVCSAILEYAKEELGFEAVRLRVEEGNAVSRRLAEKLGFSEAEELQSTRIRIMRLCFE